MWKFEYVAQTSAESIVYMVQGICPDRNDVWAVLEKLATVKGLAIISASENVYVDDKLFKSLPFTREAILMTYEEANAYLKEKWSNNG
jgi:hypothetical protein